MRHLVVFDTDHIQEFIFATLFLKEIRGASALLDELNRGTEELIKARGGLAVYVGGGGGLARFPEAAKAQEFCGALEARYRDRAAGAAITAWWESREEGEPVRDWLKRAERGLRRRKDEKARLLPLVRRAHFKVCDLCGGQPASRPRSGDPTRQVCPACFSRGQESPRYKHSLIYQHLEKIFPDPAPPWPEDLEDIGEASTPRGYVGLIYADGNRMGDRRQDYLDKFQGDDEATFGALRDFSRALDGASRWAAVEAVREGLGCPPDGRVYPVQFFITGGDDLAAVVPAHLAVPVALDFCDKFAYLFQHGSSRPELEAFSGTGLEASISVGVAIAKDHYPLHRLLHTGRELLKSAKGLHRHRWGTEGKDIATLDFLATSAPLLEPLEEQRQKLAGDGLRRYQRPYTREDLGKLADGIRRLKAGGFPRNKVGAMADFLFQGRLQACLDYLVLLSRLSGEGTSSPRGALLAVAGDFGLHPFPWRERPEGDFETPLLDLVELYDFIY